MKKIINGKKYDTETATFIVEDYSQFDGNYSQDFYYRKRTGEFFRKYYSNGIYGSEGIEPLTLKEAKERLERILDGDEYEKVFGEVEE